MKKSILITLTLILFLSITVYIHQSNKPVTAAKTISNKYTVTSVHSDYIEVELNKNKGEYINFYYADQTKKDKFNINDKVVAYFKPYKDSYQIVDFKKVNQQLTTYDYVITSIQEDGIYGKSLNNDTGIYLTQANVKGLNLSVKDSIRVSFPNNSYEQITSVQKLENNHQN